MSAESLAPLPLFLPFSLSHTQTIFFWVGTTRRLLRFHSHDRKPGAAGGGRAKPASRKGPLQRSATIDGSEDFFS